MTHRRLRALVRPACLQDNDGLARLFGTRNLTPNYRLEYALAQSNLPRSILRAPGNNSLAFAVESFIDELAVTSGQDPFEFRMGLLGDDREFSFDEDYPVINTARMKAVLRSVASQANWGAPLPKGSGRGIASHFTFGTYVAYVFEVTFDFKTKALRVDKVFAAIDCGVCVNPLGVKSQVEGAVNDALHAALHAEITVSNGRVDQSNFHDYRLARMHESATSIDVHIINSGFPITGVGEPPFPPAFPALTNAIRNATGLRIRRLPIGDQLNSVRL